jgi:hypothetical protein
VDKASRKEAKFQHDAILSQSIINNLSNKGFHVLRSTSLRSGGFLKQMRTFNNK